MTIKQVRKAKKVLDRLCPVLDHYKMMFEQIADSYQDVKDLPEELTTLNRLFDLSIDQVAKYGTELFNLKEEIR